MGDTINDGGAAFPRIASWDHRTESILDFGDAGMTLRDWFAGQALCSIPIRGWENPDGSLPGDIFIRWAGAAYHLADAMLKAREVSHG